MGAFFLITNDLNPSVPAGHLPFQGRLISAYSAPLKGELSAELTEGFQPAYTPNFALRTSAVLRATSAVRQAQRLMRSGCFMS